MPSEQHTSQDQRAQHVWARNRGHHCSVHPRMSCLQGNLPPSVRACVVYRADQKRLAREWLQHVHEQQRKRSLLHAGRTRIEAVEGCALAPVTVPSGGTRRA